MIMPSIVLLFMAPVQQQQECRLADVSEALGGLPLQAAGDGLWIGGVAFSAADIQSVEVTESSAILSQWELKLKFTTSGNAKFIDAQRCGPGSIVEISLDRKVLSQPQLIETILGGEASVSGSPGHDEWLEIAKRIPVATP